MVPMLSELWRVARYLVTPEGPSAGGRAGAEAPALLGAAKALFWAGVSVLAGLALSRLGG